jgi:biopolymer transport protein ExbD
MTNGGSTIALGLSSFFHSSLGIRHSSFFPTMPLKLQHDEIPALNLTSMIDVLFLLIIFFMVSTKFDELERNIDVAIPEVAQAGETSPPVKPIVVAVFADGHIELDDEVVSIADLVQQLSSRGGLSSPSVVIRGDATCQYQHVATALAACRQANISELGIAVRIDGVGPSFR